MEYIGHLPSCDPLYDFLKYDIMPQVGCSGAEGFRVFASKSSHAVYIYEDRASNVKVVGKFFAAGEPDRERAKRKMYREFHNINEFRTLTGESHYVARALGCNENLDCLLVVEYCYGEALDSIIRRAITEKNDALLFDKLKALANFLATVHNRSARPVMVDFHRICNYAENIIRQLSGILHPGEAEYFYHRITRYRHDPLMYQDQEVTTHGDATPANFFFGDGMYVITFDLERMQRSDRLFDTGRIAGELQHFFLQHTGNKYAAEPFIGHFLWEYCTHFPDRDRAFASITARVPFYMAMTLLRIARNNYFDRSYRRKLIDEAKLTLA
ncbi:MAG: aminoglycoside phosphotransferase family protein [Lentisphaerae bacterium]|nr:aminoglycoside phosphotransferase family protein [Lentisphaerota bacterium]